MFTMNTPRPALAPPRSRQLGPRGTSLDALVPSNSSSPQREAGDASADAAGDGTGYWPGDAAGDVAGDAARDPAVDPARDAGRTGNCGGPAPSLAC